MRFDFLSSLRSLSRDAKLYLLSNVMQATSVGALAILYTLFLTALGYDAQFIGALAVIGTLGGALGLIPSGALLDRVGWRSTLIFSNALGGAAILTQLLIPQQPVVLYVTTFLVGISVAMTIVVNAPLLAGASTPAERTTLFGVNNALNFLAGVLGTLLGGFLPEWLKSPAVQNSAIFTALDPLLVADPTARSYQAALLIVGALAIPSLIPIFLMRDERTRAASAPEPAPKPHPTPHAEMSWRERARLLTNEGKLLARGPIGRFSASQVFIGLGAGLFFPFLSIYFVNELGATTAQFGVLSSIQTVLLAGAALLSAPLAARFGKLRSVDRGAGALASLPDRPGRLAAAWRRGGGVPRARLADEPWRARPPGVLHGGRARGQAWPRQQRLQRRVAGRMGAGRAHRRLTDHVCRIRLAVSGRGGLLRNEHLAAGVVVRRRQTERRE